MPLSWLNNQGYQKS